MGTRAEARLELHIELPEMRDLKEILLTLANQLKLLKPEGILETEKTVSECQSQKVLPASLPPTPQSLFISLP